MFRSNFFENVVSGIEEEKGAKPRNKNELFLLLKCATPNNKILLVGLFYFLLLKGLDQGDLFICVQITFKNRIDHLAGFQFLKNIIC